MTLTEFLLARIAEDEAAARACVYPPHDGYKPHPELSRWFYREGGEVEYVQTPEMLAHKYPERLHVTCDSEGLTPAVGEVHGEHIARHDPARVLAECEAKRQVVHEWQTFGKLADPSVQPSTDEEFRVHAAAIGIRQGLARALSHLALPCADHPDYRQEWKP